MKSSSPSREHTLKNKTIWHTLRNSSVFQMALFFTLIMATRSSFADWNPVPTGSMKPTILEGDLIFVNRAAYDLKLPFTTKHIARWSDPENGDVVVAYSPEDGQRIVKRVVAGPGDMLYVDGNRLVVNGARPDYQEYSLPELVNEPQHWLFEEHWGSRTNLIMLGTQPRSIAPRISMKVPDNQFFLMGDHRDNSFDSRFYGTVERQQILGEAVGVIGSLDIKQNWQPRWRRFFSDLEFESARSGAQDG